MAIYKIFLGAFMAQWSFTMPEDSGLSLVIVFHKRYKKTEWGLRLDKHFSVAGIKPGCCSDCNLWVEKILLTSLQSGIGQIKKLNIFVWSFSRSKHIFVEHLCLIEFYFLLTIFFTHQENIFVFLRLGKNFSISSVGFCTAKDAIRSFRGSCIAG